MNRSLRRKLAFGGVAVLAVVAVPGIPFAAQATDAAPARASVSLQGSQDDETMMGDSAEAGMMSSENGHEGTGCEKMMAAPGHEKMMAARGHEKMMGGSSRHGMS